MEYSSDWLLSLKEDYIQESNKSPIFISNWDSTNAKAKYPSSIINSSLNKAKKSAYKYLFADEQIKSKERIIDLLKSNNIKLDIPNITLTVSATASLYLALISLNKKKIKRFLVFTPVYYTIQETLKDINAIVTYFPLIDTNNFYVNLKKLLAVIHEKEIEAIVFCDPIYSAGIELPNEVYRFLSEISNEKKIWIICDYTLGGLEWNKAVFTQFSYDKIRMLTKTEYFIFIDSISKRLLVNGIKISVVIGSPNLISEIENYAAQIYGGFSSSQLEFLKEIYLPANTKDLSFMMNRNVMIMKDNHERITAVLNDTQYEIYAANSGYFTMIVHKKLKLKEVDSKRMIRNFLHEENLLAFPSFHFSFDDENKFGFRVNMSQDLKSFVPALEKCIRKNVK